MTKPGCINADPYTPPAVSNWVQEEGRVEIITYNGAKAIGVFVGNLRTTVISLAKVQSLLNETRFYGVAG